MKFSEYMNEKDKLKRSKIKIDRYDYDDDHDLAYNTKMDITIEDDVIAEKFFKYMERDWDGRMHKVDGLTVITYTFNTFAANDFMYDYKKFKKKFKKQVV